MKKLTALTVALFLFTACGSDNNSETFTYDLTQNGCPTGSKSFSSRSDMCKSLADDKANNFCAHTLRCQKFINDCSDLNIDTSCSPSSNGLRSNDSQLQK